MPCYCTQIQSATTVKCERCQTHTAAPNCYDIRVFDYHTRASDWTCCRRVTARTVDSGWVESPRVGIFPIASCKRIVGFDVFTGRPYTFAHWQWTVIKGYSWRSIAAHAISPFFKSRTWIVVRVNCVRNAFCGYVRKSQFNISDVFSLGCPIAFQVCIRIPDRNTICWPHTE